MYDIYYSLYLHGIFIDRQFFNIENVFIRLKINRTNIGDNTLEKIVFKKTAFMNEIENLMDAKDYNTVHGHLHCRNSKMQGLSTRIDYKA